MLLNKAWRESFSPDGTLLSSVVVEVVVGELRGGCFSSDGTLYYFTSVSCPVSICPARKKLNWFLQGNKAERRSLPLFQIYRVQVVVTQYNYLLRAHQTLHVTEFNIHLNIFIAGQAVRAGLNMKP